MDGMHFSYVQVLLSSFSKFSQISELGEEKENSRLPVMSGCEICGPSYFVNHRMVRALYEIFFLKKYSCKETFKLYFYSFTVMSIYVDTNIVTKTIKFCTYSIQNLYILTICSNILRKKIYWGSKILNINNMINRPKHSASIYNCNKNLYSKKVLL